MVKRVLAWLTFITVLIATYLVFMWVPNERIMGPVQKIFIFMCQQHGLAFLPFLWFLLQGYYISGQGTKSGMLLVLLRQK